MSRIYPSVSWSSVWELPYNVWLGYARDYDAIVKAEKERASRPPGK